MTGPLWGLEPTGAHVELEGIDLLDVADGLIVRNDAVPDGMSLARQLGLLPEAGLGAEQRLFARLQRRTKAPRRAAAKRDLERVADGVWLLRGGVPRTMNVYLLEDEGGGVTLFDAGIEPDDATRSPRPPRRSAGSTASCSATPTPTTAARRPACGVPVFCHPADRAAAESDEPARDYHRPRARSASPARWVYPRLLRYWDGGAVEIAGTVDEGDDVSGFRVVHLPGPRARADRPVPRARPARADERLLLRDRPGDVAPQARRAPPHAAFNEDTEQARESIRKLAALEPVGRLARPRSTR